MWFENQNLQFKRLNQLLISLYCTNKLMIGVKLGFGNGHQTGDLQDVYFLAF